MQSPSWPASLFVTGLPACYTIPTLKPPPESMSNRPSFSWYCLGDQFWQLGKSMSDSWSTFDSHREDECPSTALTRSKTLDGLRGDPDDEKLRTTLREETTGPGGLPGISHHVHAAKEGKYKWAPWPQGVRLCVRALPERDGKPMTDFVIQGDCLILPWPFGQCQPNDDLIGRAGNMPTGVSRDDDVFVDAVMSVADSLVRSKLRPVVEDIRGRPTVVKALMDDVIAEHFPYASPLPGRFSVEIRDELTTDRSHLEVQADRVHLVLGWKPQAEQEFEPWPCGGF